MSRAKKKAHCIVQRIMIYGFGSIPIVFEKCSSVIFCASICKRTRYILTCMVNQTRAIVKTIMLNVFFSHMDSVFILYVCICCSVVISVCLVFVWFRIHKNAKLNIDGYLIICFVAIFSVHTRGFSIYSYDKNWL